MKLLKRVSRLTGSLAVEQGPGSGVWLVEDGASGTVATKAQVEAICLPHPAGAGRRMLRQVPAGVTLIEVVDGRPATKYPRPLEDMRVR